MSTLSIVMPVFNGTAYVENAIRCVQAQTLRDWELLVVDDASTDDTGAIVARLAAMDERVKLHVCPTNGGSYRARNIGLDNARGKWVGVVDADDAYAPERFERMVAAAERHGADFVADNQRLIDFHAGLQAERGFLLSSGRADWQDLTLEMLFRNDRPLTHFNLGLLKPVFRRSFLEEKRLRYADDQRTNEDFYFYARVLAEGACAILLDAPMYDYTLPLGRASGRRSPNNRTLTNLATCIELSERFLRAYGPRLSADQSDAVEARRAEFVRHERFQTLRSQPGLRGKVTLAAFIAAEPPYREALIRRVLKRPSKPQELK